MSANYPIKFRPILKKRIWGGDKLVKVLNKKSQKINIGESWELSGVEGDTSIVVNGKLKGKSLQYLMSTYKSSLVGKKVYKKFGERFPLLIKFIDAREALSIQLHPDDKLAKERHNSLGKTEMWYVMDADKEGNLIVGFKKNVTKEQYLEHLKNKSLLEIMNVDQVKKGDVYFIPAGRVHAIGAGVLLAEIQQTSDITYRVYDWNRVDDNGRSRELHTELALDAIDYNAREQYKTNYNKTLNKSSNIIDCKYFTSNIISIEGEMDFDHSNKDSFVIYICVEGIVSIEFHMNKKVKLKKGETVLIPAELDNITIASKGLSELLEVYIK
ncbi:MAG: class I mannose-6-phosphate isomerase [Flavobacteriaceae bacterium]|nr:class I mannose-6-phosphate isomerase [Flavobacteriaceae bacterium]